MIDRISEVFEAASGAGFKRFVFQVPVKIHSIVMHLGSVRTDDTAVVRLKDAANNIRGALDFCPAELGKDVVRQDLVCWKLGAGGGCVDVLYPPEVQKITLTYSRGQ